MIESTVTCGHACCGCAEPNHLHLDVPAACPDCDRLNGLAAAAGLIAQRLAEAPPAVVDLVFCDEDHNGIGPVEHHPDWHKPCDRDSLYLDLHGAREKLCRAQTLFADPVDRRALGRAIELIDRVGARQCPEQWSRFDQPTPTVVDLMEALEASLAAAKQTLGAKQPADPGAGRTSTGREPAGLDPAPGPPSAGGES